MTAHAEPTTEAHHPGPAQYAVIAAILTVITIMEVIVFYIEAMRPLLIPVLGVMSAVKFTLVVMFYMHLKFDHVAFTRMLLVGLLLAFAVVMALLALFFLAHPAMHP